jgi:hypothetical protein
LRTLFFFRDRSLLKLTDHIPLLGFRRAFGALVKQTQLALVRALWCEP